LVGFPPFSVEAEAALQHSGRGRGRTGNGNRNGNDSALTSVPAGASQCDALQPGSDPGSSNPSAATLERICRADVVFPHDASHSGATRSPASCKGPRLTDQAMAFVRHLLRSDPEDRLRPEDAADHPWLRAGDRDGNGDGDGILAEDHDVGERLDARAGVHCCISISGSGSGSGSPRSWSEATAGITCDVSAPAVPDSTTAEETEGQDKILARSDSDFHSGAGDRSGTRAHARAPLQVISQATQGIPLSSIGWGKEGMTEANAGAGPMAAIPAAGSGLRSRAGSSAISGELESGRSRSQPVLAEQEKDDSGAVSGSGLGDSCSDWRRFLL